jgi:hypothetical protein
VSEGKRPATTIGPVHPVLPHDMDENAAELEAGPPQDVQQSLLRRLVAFAEAPEPLSTTVANTSGLPAVRADVVSRLPRSTSAPTLGFPIPQLLFECICGRPTAAEAPVGVCGAATEGKHATSCRRSTDTASLPVLGYSRQAPLASPLTHAPRNHPPFMRASRVK